MPQKDTSRRFAIRDVASGRPRPAFGNVSPSKNKNFMCSLLNSQIAQFRTLNNGLRWSLIDLKGDNPIYYSPDFSEFYHYIWRSKLPSSASNINLDQSSICYHTIRMYEQSGQTPYQMIVSIPTLLEFLKSLQRRSAARDQVATDEFIEGIIHQYKDIRNQRGYLLSSEDVSAIFSKMTSHIPSLKDQVGLSEFARLISERRIGTHLDAFGAEAVLEARRVSESRFIKMFDTFNKKRARHPNELEKDFEFRNWADALNICYTDSLNQILQDTNISYVGNVPVSRHINIPDFEKSLRNFTVPFFLISAHQRFSDGSGSKIKDRMFHTIELFAKQSSTVLSILESDTVNSFDDLVEDELDLIAYCKSLLAKYYSGNYADPDYSITEKERLLGIISDRKKLRQYLEESSESTKGFARSIFSDVSEFQDERFIDDFDIRTSEYAKEMSSSLGIEFG